MQILAMDFSKTKIVSDTDPTELRTHVLWELALGEKFSHRYTEDD